MKLTKDYWDGTLKSQPHISVVTPVYGVNLELETLYEHICSELSSITDYFEIIMVNDHSPDNAWEVIQGLAKKDSRVRGVNLSRNFGQHHAISAGLSFVRGDWCVVMDCDLQDKPEEIINLYSKSQEGYEIVVGRRTQRMDNIAKKTTSKLFYMVFNYLTDQNLNSSVANFGIYSKKVIDALKLFDERDRSFGLLVTLVGFSRTEIDIKHAERPVGSTSYSFRMRLRMAEEHILSHSNKPLKLAIKLGLLITATTSIYIVYLILMYLLYSSSVEGWYSLMVSMFFLSGVMISMIGMVGLYVGRIYNEVKGRPLFIIDTTTFMDGTDSNMKRTSR